MADLTYSFKSSLAAKYGVPEAIMLSNLIYWIAKNEANGKHYHDGRYWTYSSVSAFVKLFPFWSKKQIRTVLDSLEKQGAILKGDYNEQRYDRTSWYGLTDDFIASQNGKSNCQKGQMEMPEKANGSDQKGEPIPDIKPDIITDSKSIANAIHNPDHEIPELEEEKPFLGEVISVDIWKVNNTAPEADLRKEKSSAKKEKKSADLTPTEFTAWLEARGVSHDLAAEWAEFRRKSRNTNSPRALAPIEKALKELEAEGITPDQAIEVALTIDPANGKKKSWETLVADWVRSYLARVNSTGQARTAYGHQAPVSKFDQNTNAMADAIDYLNNRV